MSTFQVRQKLAEQQSDGPKERQEMMGQEVVGGNKRNSSGAQRLYFANPRLFPSLCLCLRKHMSATQNHAGNSVGKTRVIRLAELQQRMVSGVCPSKHVALPCQILEAKQGQWPWWAVGWETPKEDSAEEGDSRPRQSISCLENSMSGHGTWTQLNGSNPPKQAQLRETISRSASTLSEDLYLGMPSTRTKIPSARPKRDLAESKTGTIQIMHCRKGSGNLTSVPVQMYKVWVQRKFYSCAGKLGL